MSYSKSSKGGSYSSKSSKGTSMSYSSKSYKEAKSSKSCTPDSPFNFSTVYTMDNQPENHISIYERDQQDGTLNFISTVATGGSGFQLQFDPATDPAPLRPQQDPLASTGSIIVAGSETQKCLLAVNAGSNTVSTFKIGAAPDELTLVGTFETGGMIPVSITERNGLVYVLNAGGNGSIMGFNLVPFTCLLFPFGAPTALNQTVPAPDGILSATPAQIGFTPENNILVTIKQTNGGGPDFENQTGSLNVYEVNQNDGTIIVGSLIQTSLSRGGFGTLPFSFTFDDSGNLLLIELAGIEGSFDRGVVSVMTNIDSDPPLLTSEAESGATATCWIEYNPLTSCIYTTNNGSRSISSFYLNEDSEVELVSNDLGGGLDAPIDMIQSADSKYLYALSTGAQTEDLQPLIYVYEMTGDCGLKQVQVIADGLDDEATRSAADGGVVNGYVGLALF